MKLNINFKTLALLLCIAMCVGVALTWTYENEFKFHEWSLFTICIGIPIAIIGYITNYFIVLNKTN